MSLTVDSAAQAAEVEYDRLMGMFVAEKEFTEQEHLWFRDELLNRWEQSKVALAAASEAEMVLRKQFVKFAFDPNKEKGTERIELANGYQAKAVKKLNYNVIQDEVNAALDEIENVGGAEGKFISERLIKWKAELSMTEYNQLDEKYKKIIDKAITTSEGAPTLEIVAPKTTKRV